MEYQDPLVLFDKWYQAHLENGEFEPTAMTLATVDEQGMPRARVVLLKQHDEKGFCFFTNYQSRKAQDLMESPKASLVFHWPKPIHRQVRISGLVEKMSREESQGYFKSRNRGSQIGAWASPQSQPIKSRQDLEDAVDKFEREFAGKNVPCPEHWGGFRLRPLIVEFWESQSHRLHDRMRWFREDLNEKWQQERLAP